MALEGPSNLMIQRSLTPKCLLKRVFALIYYHKVLSAGSNAPRICVSMVPRAQVDQANLLYVSRIPIADARAISLRICTAMAT
jgi:hypothetical protein